MAPPAAVRITVARRRCRRAIAGALARAVLQCSKFFLDRCIPRAYMRHCCDAAVQQKMEMMMSPKIQADYAKAFASFKLPQLDLQALAELQSRNFDAVLQASQILADAGKAVVRQQIEL